MSLDRGWVRGMGRGRFFLGYGFGTGNLVRVVILEVVGGSIFVIGGGSICCC